MDETGKPINIDLDSFFLVEAGLSLSSLGIVGLNKLWIQAREFPSD